MSVLREIAVFLCGFLSLRLCGAQIPFMGKCPEVNVISNFDASRYLGRWYEAEKYFAFFEFGGRCITADYGENDGLITVKNRQTNFFTGKNIEINGYATLDTRTGEAKLLVTFPDQPINITSPYWVVDTDYDSYSVVLSCFKLTSAIHTRSAWILTRERNPPQMVLTKAYEAIKNNNIDATYFSKTDQKSCPTEADH